MDEINHKSLVKIPHVRLVYILLDMGFVNALVYMPQYVYVRT